MKSTCPSFRNMTECNDRPEKWNHDLASMNMSSQAKIDIEFNIGVSYVFNVIWPVTIENAKFIFITIFLTILSTMDDSPPLMSLETTLKDSILFCRIG